VPGPDSILATRTTTRLLDALRDKSNEPIWGQFDARYRPVLAGLARRLGLRDTDADEVAQQSLVEFMCAYREGRYDRSKGRLSSWLLGIAHHTALKFLRGQRHPLHAGEDVALPALPEEQALRECGMSVDQVYVAKSRLTKRLRALVAEMTAAFEVDA